MKLREYFDTHSVKIRVFARKANVSIRTVYSIMQGHDLTLSVALRIEEATHGCVTLYDMKPNLPNGKKVRKILPKKKETPKE